MKKIVLALALLLTLPCFISARRTGSEMIEQYYSIEQYYYDNPMVTEPDYSDNVYRFYVTSFSGKMTCVIMESLPAHKRVIMRIAGLAEQKPTETTDSLVRYPVNGLKTVEPGYIILRYRKGGLYSLGVASGMKLAMFYMLEQVRT